MRMCVSVSVYKWACVWVCICIYIIISKHLNWNFHAKSRIIEFLLLFFFSFLLKKWENWNIYDLWWCSLYPSHSISCINLYKLCNKRSSLNVSLKDDFTWMYFTCICVWFSMWFFISSFKCIEWKGLRIFF